MRKPVLFEDATTYYNKWVSGIASREHASQKIGIKELLKKDQEHFDHHPNQKQDNVTIPYPIPNATVALGDVITSATNSVTLFRHALTNPALKDKRARAEIIYVIKTLKQCLNLIEKLILRLQKLS